MGYQDVLDKLKKAFSRSLTFFFVISLAPFSSRCHEALNTAYDWTVVAQVLWALVLWTRTQLQWLRSVLVIPEIELLPCLPPRGAVIRKVQGFVPFKVPKAPVLQFIV